MLSTDIGSVPLLTVDVSTRNSDGDGYITVRGLLTARSGRLKVLFNTLPYGIVTL